MDVPSQSENALSSPGDSLQIMEKERQKVHSKRKEKPRELSSLQVCGDKLSIEKKGDEEEEEKVKEASKGKHICPRLIVATLQR